MRSAYIVGILLSLILAVGIGTASAITNSGFESGDFTGWTVDGTAVIDSSNPHTGTYCAATCTPVTAPGSISVQIDFTNAQTLTLYGNGGGNGYVKIDSTNLETGIDDAGWVLHTYDVSSYTGIHTLTLGSNNVPWFVDDISISYGAAVTGASTGVTSNCINFSAIGSGSTTWWQYGTVSGRYAWKTENVTPVDGIANTTECGTPLMSNTLFYYRACNEEGCGAESSTTLAAVTPRPASTFGTVARNISVAHFDIRVMGVSVTEPFVWAAANADIVFGVLLFFVFSGLWLRQREVILPILLGLIGSGLLLYSGATSVGIPPEMLIIVIGLVSAGLAGVIMGMFKR